MQINKRELINAMLNSWHTLAWMAAAVAVMGAAAYFPWTSIWFYLALLSIYVIYYFAVAAKQVQVYASGQGMHLRVLGNMKCLKGRGYYPAPVILNANLQTLFAAAGRPDPGIKYHRELAQNVYTDGEVCVLDWSLAKGKERYSDSNPVVILFHGLTGGSDDSNMHYLTKYINEKGWHLVIPVRRGCADASAKGVSKGRHYAYGDLADTDRVVEYISDKMSGHPLYAAGISAGSNVMCNYLGTYGNNTKIRAAISIANGYCWEKGTAAIRDNHPVWDVVMSAVVHHHLFDRHDGVFNELDGAEEKTTWANPTPVANPNEPSPNSGDARNKKATFANAETTQKVASMREYDELYSRRIHGFDSLSDFYKEQSCLHRLHKIAVPVIFLNALDDPLASYQNIPYQKIEDNPHLMLVTTESGGHLGWAEGWWPFKNEMTWMDKFIVDGLGSLMKETTWMETHAWRETAEPMLRRALSTSSLSSQASSDISGSGYNTPTSFGSGSARGTPLKSAHNDSLYHGRTHSNGSVGSVGGHGGHNTSSMMGAKRLSREAFMDGLAQGGLAADLR